MFATLSGVGFKTAVESLLQGSSSEYINFYIDGYTLYMQTSENIIKQVSVPITYLKEDEYNDVSVELSKVVKLIDEDELITIEYHGATQDNKSEVLSSLKRLEGSDDVVKTGVVRIYQTQFSYDAYVVPLKRVELNYDYHALTHFSKIDLQNLIKDIRPLDEVGKSIAMAEVVRMHNGRAYIGYSNTVYSGTINLPDCVITNSAIKKLSKALSSKEDFRYTFDAEHGLIYFVGSESTVIAVYVQPAQVSIINGYEETLKKAVKATTVDLTKYSDKISNLCKIYTKGKLDVSFTDTGLSFYVRDSKSFFRLGAIDSPLLTINISLAQLNAFNQIFGDYSLVDIYKGRNYVCIQSGKKSLMLSGQIY